MQQAIELLTNELKREEKRLADREGFLESSLKTVEQDKEWITILNRNIQSLTEALQMLQGSV